MRSLEASKVGRRGTVVIPARLRKRFGIREGTYVIAEERKGGILIRPAELRLVETYTPERVAEFLLSNSVGRREYRANREKVRKMGLDPDRINHHRPAEV